MERRDRPGDPYGGVFIAAKSELLLVRDNNLETDCELLWCNLHVTGCKTIHIGAYYRPHVDDEHSLLELEKSLLEINTTHDILLGGDFNFSGWDWSNKTLKTGSSFTTLHHIFGDLLDDRGLTQLIETPTRGHNILDLMITNNPSKIRQVKVVPAISDHDCPLLDMSIRPIRYTQKRREMPLYRKARWDSFGRDLYATCDKIHVSKDTLPVNDLWLMFKKAIHVGLEKHIPHKTCKTKNNLPWITLAIKRLIKQRDRTNIKQKKIQSWKPWSAHAQARREVEGLEG